jgi:hypothetical protein
MIKSLIPDLDHVSLYPLDRCRKSIVESSTRQPQLENPILRGQVIFCVTCTQFSRSTLNSLKSQIPHVVFFFFFFFFNNRGKKKKKKLNYGTKKVEGESFQLHGIKYVDK